MIVEPSMLLLYSISYDTLSMLPLLAIIAVFYENSIVSLSNFLIFSAVSMLALCFSLSISCIFCNSIILVLFLNSSALSFFIISLYLALHSSIYAFSQAVNAKGLDWVFGSCFYTFTLYLWWGMFTCRFIFYEELMGRLIYRYIYLWNSYKYMICLL